MESILRHIVCDSDENNMMSLGRFFNGTKNRIYYGYLFLRFLGLKASLSEILRQIYSKYTQLGLIKDLNDEVALPAKGNDTYKLYPASRQDMKEAFQKISSECRKSARLLLQRKWLYDCGFTNWYIARSRGSNDPCFIQGVLLPENYHRFDNSFKNWFPRLKEDEIFLEGAYAFEKYRGSSLCHEIAVDVRSIYKQLGFKKMIICVKKDNHASLRAAAKTGFQKFEEVPVQKILFFTKREFSRNRI